MKYVVLEILEKTFSPSSIILLLAVLVNLNTIQRIHIIQTIVPSHIRCRTDHPPQPRVVTVNLVKHIIPMRRPFLIQSSKGGARTRPDARSGIFRARLLVAALSNRRRPW